MRRHALVALMLVAASLGAMVADAQRPPPDEPTTLKESECYLCHSEGGGSLGPALPLLYLVHGPTDLKIPVGETATFEVAVENAWVSELKDIVAVVDLGEVPFIGFSSDKDALSETLTGTVAAAVGNDERVERTSFAVEPGASDLVITLAPGDGATPPASILGLRLWTPGQDPDKQSPAFDEQGTTAGESVTVEVHGAREITELGVGTWTAEIVVPALLENPTGVPEQPYELTVATEFRNTGEAEQFTGTSDVLQSRVEEPGRLAYLQWTVVVESVPSAPTTIPVEVIVTAHYAHGSTQISAYDDWHYTKTILVDVKPDPAGGGVIITSGVAEIIQVKAGFPTDILSEVIGYLSAVMILASIYTGGMFGKTSRRQLNAVFGTAKRRVAFHNFLSYGILLTAIVHMILFLVESAFDWTLGIIWGGIAILAMIGLGVTGALQVPMIRKWNYATWRWSHFYLAIGTIVFTIVHILLDGVHFVELQEMVGWSNPFTRA